MDVELDHYEKNGWLLTRDLDADGARALQSWVDEVSGWSDDDGDWLHYREMTDDGPKLCRTENFMPFHAGLRGLLTSGSMLTTAPALLGEPAFLYKEKINYKLAGGAGYAPHQDAPAYRFVDIHVSCKAGGHDAVRLRRWDDLGKVDGLAVLPLRDYVPLLISLAH